MNENLDTADFGIQAALRNYAAPIADNGFTQATLQRTQHMKALRRPILGAAGAIGALSAVSQMPNLWRLLHQLNIPHISPLFVTALGVFGFVAWAALDRERSDTV